MSVKNQPSIITKLESGLILEYPPELDGGGLEERFDFLELISLAESNGLKLCGNYPASFNRSQGRILHFKASELS